MQYVRVMSLLLLAVAVTGCSGSVNQYFGRSDGGVPGSGNADPSVVWNGVSLSGTLTCDQGSIIRETGTTTNLTWTYTNPPTPIPPLQFSFRTEPVSATMGTFTPTGSLAATYTAPASLPYNLTTTLIARSPDISVSAAPCEIHVPENGAIGILDDGYTRGLTGKVYPLLSGTTKLADASGNPLPFVNKSVEDILIGEVNLPDQSFSLGFPDVPNLNEWFAIAFKGRLIVPTTGTWYFQLAADDGALFYIDGHDAAHVVINNDGQHAYHYKLSGGIPLTAGNHDIYVDWFQGPKYCLGIQLYWSQTAGGLGTDGSGSTCSSGTPPAAPWQIVPWNAFLRPE